MKICTICGKELSSNRFSTKDKYELPKNTFICKDCANKIGINNMFSASVYSAEKAKKKYYEMYPAELYEDQAEEKMQADMITQKTIFCGKCGAKVMPNSKFCNECGKPLFDKKVNVVSSASQTPMDNKSVPPKKSSPIKAILVVLATFIILCVLVSQCGKSSDTGGGDVVSDVTEKNEEDVLNVFYIDLFNDVGAYTGKKITITVPVDGIGQDGKVYAEKTFVDSSLVISTNDEALYEKSDEVKYLTVSGTVFYDNYDIEVRDCTILYAGTESPERFEEQLNTYKELVVLGKQLEREEFVNAAREVSFDELRRNPDTYTGEKLKLSVQIEEVEPDSLFSNGTVWATYQGNEIVIYDNRENREPRLMAGDTLTVFCEGYGMTNVKTYLEGSGLLGSDFGAEVIDERETVAVSMVYTEKEDVSKYYANSVQDYEYYLKGFEFSQQEQTSEQ